MSINLLLIGLTINSEIKKEIRWMPGSQFDEYTMEPAGNELFNKGSLLMYVARASHLGGVVVGKYSPHLHNMYIGYNGREPVKAEFEVSLENILFRDKISFD